MTDFSILTVCTGNICRSPLAEQLLRAGMARWPGVSVASAGTDAFADQPMTDQAQVLAREFGVNNSHSHVARSLTVDQLTGADLVIALSREHRRSVVELLPRGARHTFTLRELARLLTNVPDEDLSMIAALDTTDVAGRLSALVDVAASRRGMVEPPEAAEDDDVIDPYGQHDNIHCQSSDQRVPAVTTVLSQFARALTVVRP